MKALTKLTMKTIEWSLDLSGLRQTFVAHIYVCFPARGHTSHSRPHLRVVKHDGIISLPPRGRHHGGGRTWNTRVRMAQ